MAKRIISYWIKNKKYQTDNNKNIPFEKLSRNDDLPNYIGNDCNNWYKNGKLHRDNDLPASICENGQLLFWYKNGKFHRDNNKPAVTRYEGSYRHSESYYIDDNLHREDGPATIHYYNGIIIKKYYYNGNEYTKEFCDDNNIPLLIKNWTKQHHIQFKLIS